MDAVIFALAIVGGLVVVRVVAHCIELRARMRGQMRSAPRGDRAIPLELPNHHYGAIDEAPRVRLAFDDDSNLEALERAARAMAEQARRDADGCAGTSVERILHKNAQARFVRFADHIKAFRLRPDAEPPPANAREGERAP